MAEIVDTPFRRVEFMRSYPGVFTDDQLSYLLRNRHTNGLIACGAVLEIYPGIGRQRPRLFIWPSKFFEWMRRGA